MGMTMTQKILAHEAGLERVCGGRIVTSEIELGRGCRRHGESLRWSVNRSRFGSGSGQ